MATISGRRTGGTDTKQQAEGSALLPSERRARNRRAAAVQQRVTRTWLRELARAAPRRDDGATA